MNCTNFEVSHKLNDVFLPLNVPIISKFLLILVNLFPFLSIFSFTNIFYLRKKVRSEKTKKLMSLIIPCRNEEKFIKNCINSVLIFHLPENIKIELFASPANAVLKEFCNPLATPNNIANSIPRIL